jgi:lipoprotein-anchoring transpeptidase ErfK/SrfK
MKKVLCGFGCAVVLAGCGGSGVQHVATQAAKPKAKATVKRCSTAARPIGSERISYAAVVRRRTAVYRTPRGGVLGRFGRLNRNKVPTVFAVVAERDTRRCEPAWYRVQVPMRPNGITGWIRASAVQLHEVDTKILIHVRAMRLELVRRGRVVLRTPISTGEPATPTPIGRFYVKERLVPTNPNGPYGPAALGTSAYSPVLKNWAQGGPVGIHGTDDPTAIGRPASHGCIRLPNAAMSRLFALTPAGTPVIIEE